MDLLDFLLLVVDEIWRKLQDEVPQIVHISKLIFNIIELLSSV
jgi:hypothetical protein